MVRFRPAQRFECRPAAGLWLRKGIFTCSAWIRIRLRFVLDQASEPRRWHQREQRRRGDVTLQTFWLLRPPVGQRALNRLVDARRAALIEC